MSTADSHVPSPSLQAPEGRAAQWLETAGDWFNPILVKEIRQSLKSRQFVLTFLLLLVGSWLVSFLNIMWYGDEIEFGSMGTVMFSWFFFVLAFAMFFVVPLTAFRSLLAERDENTFDLLSITTLAPRQVVRGKLLSAMVQLFIFYSAVTPFIAFTSMLKGFPWANALYVMVLATLVSILVCMAAVMIATLAHTKTWQTLLFMAVAVGLFVLFLMWSVIPMDRNRPGIAGMIVGETNMPFEEFAFWWINGIALVMAVSYFYLFNQIAIARMTFESDNRSTGIRIICFLQFVLAWLCIYSIWLAIWLADVIDGWYVVGWLTPYLQSVTRISPPTSEFFRYVAPVFVSMSLIHFAFVGLFTSTESLDLSRRLRRELPRRRLFRVLVAPWLPGGGRGYLYILLGLASLWLMIAVGLVLANGDSPGAVLYSVIDRNAISHGELVQFTTCGCCYVVIYCGIGCLLVQLLLPVSGELKPAHVRIVTVLLILGGVIVPYLIRSFGVNAFERYSLLMITVPFDTLDHVARGRQWADAATIMLLANAAAILLLNLRAITGGIAELHTANPERLQRIDAARHTDEV